VHGSSPLLSASVLYCRGRHRRASRLGDRAIQLPRTGALYGMVHAAASIATIALLFDLGLFALAVTGVSAFGWVRLLGGAVLLITWAPLGYTRCRAAANERRQSMRRCY
jgi:uncharacterized membrane protein YgdD (TMEM256/DUF423 family)